MTDKTDDLSDSQHPDPWEQQHGETQRQFAGFCEYRDIHPLRRSLVKVAQKLGVSDTYVERLSSQFHWVSRSTEWDRQQDRTRRDRREAEIDEMNERHAALAEAVSAKVTEAVTTLDAKTLTPNQLVKLMEVSVKTERLARGESAETAAEGPVRITADEIREGLRDAGLLDPPSVDEQLHDEAIHKWLEDGTVEDDDT